MRKSALVCVSFIASLMLTHYLGRELSFALCLTLVLGVMITLIAKRNAVLLSLIACAAVCANLIMGGIDAKFALLRENYVDNAYEGRIKVVEVLENSRAYVKVESLEGIQKGAYFNLLCSFAEGTELQKGDVMEAKLYMFAIEDKHDFPSKLYNEGRGTVLRARAYNPRLVSRSPLWSLHTELISYVENVFDKYLGEFSKLSKALFLGSKSTLDSEQRDVLSDLGIIHVLSVSGLHFAILIGIFSAVLKAFKLHKVLSSITVAVFAFFYMFLTGFSPSVCRAGIMSFFVIFDFVLRRSPDKLTTLSLTGALMCLADPTAAINISFQLSFLATFGLIAASNCISIPLKVELDEKPLGSTVQNILSSVVFSLSAMFFCLAPIAHNFQSISSLAPVANLVCTPFAELILILVFFLVPLSVLPHFASALGYLCQGVGHVFTFLCSLLNNERFVLTAHGAVFVVSSAMLTAFCILLFLVPFKRKKAALLVFVTGSAALTVICSFL